MAVRPVFFFRKQTYAHDITICLIAVHGVSKSACQSGMLLTPPTNSAISLQLQGCSVRTPFYIQPTITSTTSGTVFEEVGNGLAEALFGTFPLVFVPAPLVFPGSRLYVPKLLVIMIFTMTNSVFPSARAIAFPPRRKCATRVRGSGTISTRPPFDGRN